MILQKKSLCLLLVVNTWIITLNITKPENV
jgi:hypothetical protein